MKRAHSAEEADVMIAGFSDETEELRRWWKNQDDERVKSRFTQVDNESASDERASDIPPGCDTERNSMDNFPGG